MIQLLFLVVLMESGVIVLLTMKVGPLRHLIMNALDQVKSGKGPAMVKTLACTMAVILTSSVTSILRIQKRAAKIGTMAPMDQILLKTHLLEATLMGSALFLGFIIDRLHDQLRKLKGLRTSLESLKKQSKNFQENSLPHQGPKEDKGSTDIKSLKDEVAELKLKIKNLTLESEAKSKEVQDAESTIKALQKQSEDLLLEYDRLFEDNQNLQTQLAAYEHRF
eukprot:TRINITY_DN23548_c0_g1_i1.p1 TRINITY_DN23548_c0_g1~~TRINITY_DN23548_c0_g1_i1.p1  ORF type:complete len:222 (+),score=44.61 TRINITY_DN23548_c0_g1_i1:93-758(+)